MKLKIKEIIVVEGRDDLSAIKRAVDAEVIITGGFSLPERVMKQIEVASKKRGVIIFTDPDYPGERIRKVISQRIKGAKHAFLPKEQAIKKGDVGIENASNKSIIEALKRARFETRKSRDEFKRIDLIENKLIGNEKAAKRRNCLGNILGIGYGNAKQFLNRLNNYGVTREELELAIDKLKKESESNE